MKIASVKKLAVWDRFIYWIEERELIRLRRKAGEPKPWTDDVIFQSYRFCNVRRMDDKVSQWLYANWYKPFYNHPNMLIACTLARHFNLPTALEAIQFPEKWQPWLIKSTLRAMKTSGQKVFNGAYMVRGMSKREPHWTNCKSDQVVDRVCEPMVSRPPVLDRNSMQKSVEALLPYWGFSSFMAGQVIADMRWASKGGWKDCKTWAPVGPGSLRGMNLILEQPLTTPLPNFSECLTNLIETCTKELILDLTKRLEAIDYQNCLCEFDKYTRVLKGTGRPKQLYQGV